MSNKTQETPLRSNKRVLGWGGTLLRFLDPPQVCASPIAAVVSGQPFMGHEAFLPVDYRQRILLTLEKVSGSHRR